MPGAGSGNARRAPGWIKRSKARAPLPSSLLQPLSMHFVQIRRGATTIEVCQQYPGLTHRACAVSHPTRLAPDSCAISPILFRFSLETRFSSSYMGFAIASLKCPPVARVVIEVIVVAGGRLDALHAEMWYVLSRWHQNASMAKYSGSNYERRIFVVNWYGRKYLDLFATCTPASSRLCLPRCKSFQNECSKSVEARSDSIATTFSS